MKISRISIKSLQQFKDLEIDLTYPKGHAKAGQPLDKVCFIGQSGTGKTTLLNIIKDISTENILSGGFKMEINLDYQVDSRIQVDYCKNGFSYTRIAYNNGEKNYFNDYRPLITYGNFKHDKKIIDNVNNFYGIIDQHDKELAKNLGSRRIRLISYPLGFRYLNKSPDFLIDHNNTVLDYSKINIWELWKDITDALRLENINLTAKVLAALREPEPQKNELLKAIEKEQEVNPNMLKQIGEKALNKILSKFNLTVADDLTDPEVLNEFHFIPLKHINTDKLIQYGLLNSASTNVTLVATSLFFYKPTNAIILIDEVENSLYPDVQTSIVNDYIRIAPDNQFFFSTHSPLVASSFDPWEIIELKFDNSGNIYQDNYLKDLKRGRHVDNYKFMPNMMSWSSIIARIYDLEKDGPDERQKQIANFVALEESIKMKRIQNQEIDKRDIDQLVKLGELLDWNN